MREREGRKDGEREMEGEGSRKGGCVCERESRRLRQSEVRLRSRSGRPSFYSFSLVYRLSSRPTNFHKQDSLSFSI